MPLRRPLALLLALVVLVQLAPATGAQPAPRALPAPGGPAPTISLAVANGYAGQAVEVSGQAADGLPGVRLAWLLDEATFTVAEVQAAADSSYTASVAVPPEARPGPARLCAAPMGAERGAFACADFTVDEPPPGAVDVTLPEGVVPAGLQLQQATTLTLFDQAGNQVATGSADATGRVQIASVPPGVYQVGVGGPVARIVDLGSLRVGPGGTATTLVEVQASRFDRVTGGFCNNDNARVTVVRARYSDTGRFPLPPARDPNAPGRARSQYEARLTSVNLFYGTTPVPPQPQLGTFLNGVFLNNEFRPLVQSRLVGGVSAVNVYLRKPGDTAFTKIATVSRQGDAFPFTFNVGALRAGASELAFQPVAGADPQCSKVVTVNVAPNPFDNAFARGTIAWDPAYEIYEFSGSIPGNRGPLPIVLPSDPWRVPVLGDLGTRLDAAIRIGGWVELNNVMTLYLLDAQIDAKVLGQGLIDGQPRLTQNLLPPGGLTRYDPANPRNLLIELPERRIGGAMHEVTFFRGVLFSWFGIFNLKGAVGARFGVNAGFGVKIYPLQPRADATFSATGVVGGYLEFSGDVLGGLVEGGARGGIDAGIKLPLKIDVGAGGSGVGLRTPCFGLRGYIQPYISAVWGLFEKRLRPIELFRVEQPAGCNIVFDSLARQIGDPTRPPPRVLPQPQLAAGAGGRVVAVYLEDANPAATTAAPRVMARIYDPATGWGEPAALTDEKSFVDRPAVAFYGDGTRAMAVWAQSTLSEAESLDLGEDVLPQLRSQELFAAEWDGAAWSEPARLTNDELPDGRPALAGGSTGLTLAWVHNPSGDASNRTQSRIAVREWAGGAWGPTELLNAADANGPGSNTQVSVARVEAGCPVGCAFYQRRVALAWTFDADGDDTTGADRRIALATRLPGSGAAWELIEAPRLPAGADSPSVALSTRPGGSPDLIQLAFTVPPTDEGDGRLISLSDKAEVWAAEAYDLGAGWEVEPRRLLDEAGMAVRGERPLARSRGSEALVIFRRFSGRGDTGSLGQLAMSQLRRGDTGFAEGVSAPQYLTSGYNQHWQQSAAIGADGRLFVLAEALPYAKDAASDAELRALMADVPSLGGLSALPGSGLVWASAPTGADPALPLTLELSQAHAPVGSTVTITATVTNLGRQPVATPGTLIFYRGTPEAREAFSEWELRPLAFGERQTMVTQLVADGGEQPIFAEIVSPGDADEGNNRAFAALGAMPAPELLSAAPTALWPDAIELSLSAPPPAGVAGYQIYRRSDPSAPYELVGETGHATQYDLLLQPGVRYCYVAYAFDDAGLRSPPSNEICASLAPQRVYLPAVVR